MSAPTLPPLPSLGGETDANLRSLPPFVWNGEYLICPWESEGKRQRVTVEQDAIIARVAQAALWVAGGADAKRPSGHFVHLVWWFTADGALLGTSTVAPSWWRGRLARFVVLEVQRA